ncbi:Phosphoribosylaminoimidazole carboxylase, chloroplastic [Dendrobium catenatum]|uniref:phosphoribosylaminoimidazole carboxylase n=1 Tax=Dendrobium catenatum TaxID=906689 RepID=A0A2I0VYM7_9ASPA|nr:Phosphoribosylaminoimidazole carboxylase, chloroplastic [Dendrobium catenatum]
MGSDCDLPTMKDAAEILNTSHEPFEITIVSAHRMPERMYYFALSTKEKGIQIIIYKLSLIWNVVGIAASLTPLVVIGVPIRTSSLDGVDSLMSIMKVSDLQCEILLLISKSIGTMEVITNAKFSHWIYSSLESS